MVSFTNNGNITIRLAECKSVIIRMENIIHIYNANFHWVNFDSTVMSGGFLKGSY